MKKVVVLIICLLLTGCSKANNVDYINDLDNLLNNLDFGYNTRSNHHTDNFEYYLPSDAYEIDGTKNCAVIEVNKAKMIMNINVKAILNSKYYNDFAFVDDGFFKDSVKVYEKEGTFVCNDTHETYFNIKLYDHEDCYLVHFVTDELNFYASTSGQDLREVVRHMIIISKSCTINKDVLVAQYSAKDVIEYEKKQVDLFEYVMPNSGYLSEMVNHVNGNVINEVVEEEPQEEDIDEDIEEEEEDEEE